MSYDFNMFVFTYTHVSFFLCTVIMTKRSSFYVLMTMTKQNCKERKKLLDKNDDDKIFGSIK